MKKYLMIAILLLSSSCALAATTYQGQVGKNDLRYWDGVTSTYDRKTTTGGTLIVNKFGDYVDVLQVYGSGTVRTDTVIATALGAIGTTSKATLMLSPGTWTMSANRDWSAWTNVTWIISPGAQIFHGAYTLNFGGTFKPAVDCLSGTGALTFARFKTGIFRVFVGGQAVTFGKISVIYPQLWGALGDGNHNYLTVADTNLPALTTVFTFPTTSITRDSYAIQKAIDAGVGHKIVIPYTGTRYWISPLWAKNNTHIELQKGVELKADAATVDVAGVGGVTTHCMLRIHNVSNVTIDGNGGSFVMTFPEGEFAGATEQNHCIYVAGSKNVVVRDVRLYGSGGDGLSIGAFPTTFTDIADITGNAHPTSRRHAMHVLATRIDSDANKRQGCSITDGVDIKLQDSVMQNTNGTTPETGVDIEPNTGSIMRGVVVEGVNTSNNDGGGIVWGPYYLKDQIAELWLDANGVEQSAGTGTSYGVTHDITIRNCNSLYDRSRGIGTGQRSDAYMNATVKIHDCTITNSRNASIQLANNTYAKIFIERIKIINPNSRMTAGVADSWGSGDLQGNCGIYLYSVDDQNTRYANVDIRDIDIIDNRPVSFVINSPTTEPVPGDILVGSSSGAVGTVSSVTSWGVAGVVALVNVNGTFTAADTALFASSGANCCTITSVTDERRMWFGITTEFEVDTVAVEGIKIQDIRVSGSKSIAQGGVTIDTAFGTPSANYWKRFSLGIVPPVSPWLHNSASSSFDVFPGHSGWTFSNRIRSVTSTTYDLPAAKPGLKYGFINEQTAKRVYIARSGTDVFKGINGTAGGNLLTSGVSGGAVGYGSRITIRCDVEGEWIIESFVGPWYDNLGWQSV